MSEKILLKYAVRVFKHLYSTGLSLSNSAPMPIYIGNRILRPKLNNLSNQGPQKLATIGEDLYSWFMAEDL